MRHLILLLIGLAMGLTGWAQSIEVDAQGASLLLILKQLKRDHQIQYSGAQSVLEACEINLSRSFSSADSAIKSLTDQCDLQFVKQGEVYLISASPPPSEQGIRQFEGLVVDQLTGDVIPHAVIHSRNQQYLCNEFGEFSIPANQRKMGIRVEHLAFQSIDTTIQRRGMNVISMIPKDIMLEDIVIETGKEEGTFEYLAPHEMEILQTKRFQPGFYGGLDDFRHNRPSIDWKDLDQKERNHLYGFFQGSVKLHRLKFSRDNVREMGDLFGFCDGENIYFHKDLPNGFYEKLPRLRRGALFAKVKFMGYFAYYESHYYSYYATPNGQFMVVGHRELRVLNMTNGENFKLNRKQLEQFLSGEPDLLLSFQKEKRKKRKLSSYFEQYAKRLAAREADL